MLTKMMIPMTMIMIMMMSMMKKMISHMECLRITLAAPTTILQLTPPQPSLKIQFTTSTTTIMCGRIQVYQPRQGATSQEPPPWLLLPRTTTLIVVPKFTGRPEADPYLSLLSLAFWPLSSVALSSVCFVPFS